MKDENASNLGKKRWAKVSKKKRKEHALMMVAKRRLNKGTDTSGN